MNIPMEQQYPYTVNEDAKYTEGRIRDNQNGLFLSYIFLNVIDFLINVLNEKVYEFNPIFPTPEERINTTNHHK